MISKKFLIFSLAYLLSGLGFLLIGFISDELITSVVFYSSFVVSVVFYICSYCIMKKLEVKILDIWINIVFAVVMLIEWICFSLNLNVVGIFAEYILGFVGVFFLGASNRLKKYYQVKNRNTKLPDFMSGGIRITIGYSRRDVEILRYISEMTNFSKVFKGVSIFCFAILLMLPILSIL